MTNGNFETRLTHPRKLRAVVVSGAVLMALPVAALAADDATNAMASASSSEQATESSMPPAPRGPFFSRSMMGQNGPAAMGNFPPMGFDPMTARAPMATPEGNADGAPVPMPAQPAYPGTAYNSNVDGNLRGRGDIDVQIRGRIGLSGRGNGYGNQGWGNGFTPYGMPFNHGYGAPYGTPFSQAYAQPQPNQPTAPQGGLPADDGGASAQQMPQMPQMPQGMMGQGGVPFSWDPNANAAQQPPAPTPPQEPEWVQQQREQMEKQQAEAQQRMTDMQQNNPYYSQQRVYGQGYSQPYGQPYSQGYGAPYGAPFAMPQGMMPYAMPFGYAPQPQTMPPASSGTMN